MPSSPPGLRRSAVLLVTAFASAACAASANAIGWAPGPTLSLATNIAAPRLATDQAGLSYLVHGANESGQAVLYVGRLTAEGPRGADVRIGPGDYPQIAATANGAVVTWRGSTGTHPVMFSRIAANGTVETPRTVAGTSEANLPHSVATLPNGDAVVAWVTDKDARYYAQLHVRKIAADGTLGPIVDLGTAAESGWAGYGTVSVAPDGRARVSWIAPKLPPGDPVPPGHEVGFRATTLSATGALDGPITVALNTENGYAPEITSNAGGVAALTWFEAEDPANLSGTYRLRAARLPTNGNVPGPATTVADGLRVTGLGKAVGVAPDGTATIAYGRLTSAAFGGRMMARRLRADNTLQPEVALSGAPVANEVPSQPLLSPAQDGSTLVLWAQMPVTDNVFGQAVSRFESRVISPDGALSSQVATIQNPGATYVVYPTLAGNAAGHGIFGWVSADALGGVYDYRTALFGDNASGISAAIPATATRGDDVTFSATATDPARIATVAWQFGDGIGASGTSVTHAYGRAGSYAVTATVTDRYGNTTVFSETIQIVEPGTAPPGGGGSGGGGGATLPGGGPTPPGATPTVRAAAKLKLTKATRTTAKVTASGTLDRRTSGRVTVTWTQKVGRKTVKRTTKAKIAKGKFSATVKLSGALKTSRTPGRLTIAYAGDADTAKASVTRTLKAPKRVVR